MQQMAQFQNEAFGAELVKFAKPSQKQWDIMLAVVAGTPRQDIADQLGVSTGYVAQVAVRFGVTLNARRSSTIIFEAGEPVLLIGSAAIHFDKDDLAQVALTPWHLSRGYAASKRFGKMHRWLAEAGAGDEVDHVDGDSLNNRRCNLRIVTRAQSVRNRRRTDHAPTIFKGVSVVSGKWLAAITKDGERQVLGRYKHPVNAAVAYDNAARKLFGEYARLNFPEKGEQSALHVRDESELSLLITKGAA